jgi:phage-related minor tail protein
MPTRDIRTRLAIDGEREYKASLDSINTGLKTLNTQMSAVSAQYKGNGDSLEALNSKEELLNKQYTEQLKKLEVLEKAYANASGKVGENDKRTQQWAQSVNIAKGRLAELERQMREVADSADPVNRAIKENQDAAQGATNRIGYLNSELRALDAQYANNQDSTEYLTKKQEILDRQYQESVNRVKSLQAALRSIETQSGKNSEEYMHMESSLNDARVEMYSAESAIRQTKEQGKGLGDTISDIASKFGIQLPDGVAEAINGLGKFKDKSADTATKSVSSVESIGSAVGGLSVPIMAAIALIVEIGTKAAEAAIDVEKSASRMKVALNLTEEDANVARLAVLSVYQKGLVENKEEAESAVTAVMRAMGATGEEAADLANKLVVINKVFGQDFSESARTASTLMNTFGISGSQALDIIVTGLQTSANKNGDLLDVLNEYSPSFARLGNDAQTFLSRVVAATDAGAFSADKAADAYKEFYNKAAGQDTTFIEALKSLNLKSDAIIRDLLSGGDAANDAMSTVIDRLNGVAEQSEQAQIAAKLFGSQWEDVGTKAILAMNGLQGGVIDTTDAANRSLEELIDDFGVKWDQFWRLQDPEFQQLAYGQGYDAAKNMVDGYFQGIEENKDKVLDATKQFAKDVDQASRDTLDIKSPSGKFEDQGELSMEGYVVGVQKSVQKARRQVQASMAIISDSARYPIMSGGGSSATYSGLGQAQGGGDYIYFAPGSIVVDAKNIDDLNAIVKIAKGARQSRRSGRI